MQIPPKKKGKSSTQTRRRPPPTPTPPPPPPPPKENTPPPPPPPPYNVSWVIFWKGKELFCNSTLSSTFHFQQWIGDTIKAVQKKADEKGYNVERLKATPKITCGNKAQGDSTPAECKDEDDWANIRATASQWITEKRARVVVCISHYYGPRKEIVIDSDSMESESSIAGDSNTDSTVSKPTERKKKDSASSKKKPRRTTTVKQKEKLNQMLLLRCDYAILFDFVIYGGGTASEGNLRDFRLSLTFNRKDCKNLI